MAGGLVRHGLAPLSCLVDALTRVRRAEAELRKPVHESQRAAVHRAVAAEKREEIAMTKLVEAERLLLLMGYGSDRHQCQDCGRHVDDCTRDLDIAHGPCIGVSVRAFLGHPQKPETNDD